MTQRICPECDTTTDAEVCPKCRTRTIRDRRAQGSRDSRTPDVVIKSARFFSTIESDICQ
jgi:ribosomal protein L40E